HDPVGDGRTILVAQMKLPYRVVAGGGHRTMPRRLAIQHEIMQHRKALVAGDNQVHLDATAQPHAFHDPLAGKDGVAEPALSAMPFEPGAVPVADDKNGFAHARWITAPSR